jgi:predicted ATPase
MLNKITIKNYKSLENVSLTLRPFNVFVGPNNAGKSNLFDCLAFLSELMTPTSARQPAGTVLQAVGARGGFQYVVWGGDTNQSISVDLDVSLVDPDENKERQYNFYIELRGNQYGTSVSAIRLRRKANSGWRMLLDVQGKKWTAWGIEGRKLDRLQPRGDPEWWLEFLPYFPQAAHRVFADYVRGWRFYNFVPSRMEQVLPVRKGLNLQREGENLPVVLHTLHSSYRRAFREIEELITQIPGVEELFTELTEEGRTYTTLKERGVSLNIPNWAMSDGTLRLLAHLAVVYLPTPPPLVCFEEPESNLHPWSHEHLVEILRRLSKRTQVLVSTHSPLFLDRLRTETNDLIVVEKPEGKTTCKRISGRKGLKKALQVLGLGELWYSGSIGGVPQK